MGEQMLGDSADTHHQQIETCERVQRENITLLEESVVSLKVETQTNLSQLHEEVFRNKEALESHQEALRNVLLREKDARDAHYVAIQERLNDIEGLVSEDGRRNEVPSRELEAVKCALERMIANESRQMEASMEFRNLASRLQG